MEENTVYRRNANVLSSDLGDSEPDIVLLGKDQREYFGLKEVAGRVWQLLEQPRSFKQLKQSLLSEYDVSSEQLTADLEILIEQLSAQEIIFAAKPDELQQNEAEE